MTVGSRRKAKTLRHQFKRSSRKRFIILHFLCLSTSLTTSSAFFANALSSIVAIKNYAIFAGISILANLFYMMTLTPSVIVCIKWFYRLYIKFPKFQNLDAKISKITTTLHEFSVVIFHIFFPAIINKTWFLWICLLLIQGIGACVVFAYPKFKLPETKDFQLFPSSNVIENWDLKMTTKFQSVVTQNDAFSNEIRFEMVFGIHADEPGSRLDPDITGRNASLHLDETFDMAHPDTQSFIYETCHELLMQPFMPNDTMTCHLDAILKVLKVKCKIPLVLITLCCPENIVIPIDSELFSRCARKYEVWLDNSNLNFGSVLGSFIFKRSKSKDPKVYAYLFVVETTYIWSAANDKMS